MKSSILKDWRRAYRVKSSSVIGQAMAADAGVLESYNLGGLAPGCTP